MTTCKSWNICPLGDLAKRIGCRTNKCPTRTAADLGSPLMTVIEQPQMRRVVE